MHGIDTFVPHFFSHVQGTHIVVTPDIVSKVLHILRVVHPDYPGCARLRTVSKDKLSFLFCWTPSFWVDRQNTPCSGFAKGPRFLNMVMTFVSHPLSHYNLITDRKSTRLNSSHSRCCIRGIHVPRVVHPDYPSCDHLRTVSKYELSSLFCETPSSWGDR